ncbi:interferon regulatory factor 8-like [Scleropages formosus]|uniref:Interferon regulatory factor 8-like n=1 Tax=Scleropages formosus TaxID=113540 RepID=A0A0P7UGA7_SCLFO|nr:interferon regulatory factor 8-like [Scleropages formosus]
MSAHPSGRRLRQWLIEQIHSHQYPGLQWEDEARTMFRIPWKHAGKQDYNQEVDASIFKAWAVFKGKFKEGDRAEPATWKTRLRCALNKSPDFEEVTDRSQLDISEPYKVYRIVPEEEQKSECWILIETMSMAAFVSCRSAVAMHGGGHSDVTSMECNTADLEELIKEVSGILRRKHCPLPVLWSGIAADPWCDGDSRACALLLSPAFSQMMITFFYGGKPVGSTLSTHSEGCRIALGQPPLTSEAPYDLETLQNIRFPPVELIEHERQRHVTRKLFGHLERGVLVRANREGVFIKRLCQSRVFWSSLGSQYSPGPCKLERDAVVKIFDNARFLQALQLYQDGHYPAPDPTITLCFGEEFHDVSTAKNKLIIVQIIPVTCQQLLEEVNLLRSQYSSGTLEISDETQNDQVARIFQELCSYTVPQRLGFRENVPITV